MSINFKSYVYWGASCRRFFSRMLRDPRSHQHIRTFAGFSLLPVGVVFALYVFLENAPSLLSADSFSGSFGEASFFQGQSLLKRPMFLVDSGKNEFLRAYALLEIHEKEDIRSMSDMQEDCRSECGEFESKLREMVKGFPIEVMVPYIMQQDKTVAAMLVGIAKKESDWGNRAPSKGGSDCFNYWGYKGAGSKGTALGYGCFATPEEAVQTVGRRMHELSVELKKDTPAKMIIWKCGGTCRDHSPESVSGWIRDVNRYFSRLIALR